MAHNPKVGGGTNMLFCRRIQIHPPLFFFIYRAQFLLMTKHHYHHLILVIVAVLFVVLLYEGLTLTSESERSPVFFNAAFALQQGETQNVENILQVTFLEITDSRCSPDVRCVWEGEIGASFNVTSPDESQIIRLGTVTNPKEEFSGFVLELKDASPTEVTLMLSRK